jgi:glycosyltransferase involved in cell wall biosynthesis
MIIGIDASHIRSGGGIAHLKEILQRAKPEINKFDKIVVWSSYQTLQQLPSYDWLIKSSNVFLNKTVIHSTLWKLFKRDICVRKASCNVLFLVDSTFTRFHPSVTICHNILPFSKDAISRFKLKERIYFNLKKIDALSAFKSADKVIMLSNNSVDVVSHYYKEIAQKSTLIPHGFNIAFENANKIGVLDKEKLNKLIYISPLASYKPHWKVIAATYILLDLGYNVELILVGKGLNDLKLLSDHGVVIRPEYASRLSFLGQVPNSALPKLFSESNIFIFSSLCETFGITLVEAMSTSIPIACSNRSAMPEILRDAGVYFDPDDENDIVRCLQDIINNPKEAMARSKKAVELSKEFSWDKCASSTFGLLTEMGSNFNNK